MPDVREEFTVKAPIETAWGLLSDMTRLAHCVPGCQSARQVAENEFAWVLTAKLLRTSRAVNITTRAAEITPPHHVSFLGDGKLFEGIGFYKLSLRGAMELQPMSDDETRVIFDGNVSAAGPGGALINKIASSQLKDLLRDFEQNVRNALEKPAEGR
jgi:carbon monoxide dehydrogenase subunit G